MNVETLGRKAIDIIKEKWGLPLHGFVAGGSIANLVWELVSGNKAIVNDIDVFVLEGREKQLDTYKKSYIKKFKWILIHCCIASQH